MPDRINASKSPTVRMHDRRGEGPVRLDIKRYVPIYDLVRDVVADKLACVFKALRIAMLLNTAHAMYDSSSLPPTRSI